MGCDELTRAGVRRRIGVGDFKWEHSGMILTGAVDRQPTGLLGSPRIGIACDPAK
ncbi:MAG: hypothetical protein DHS20C16_19460 [Phycisphaerae bacterium]|nr:MAG: hypothetical protein DHS20C16_19460 [Phycisphaerae bacterium]